MARSSGMYHRSKDCIRTAVLRIYWYEEGGPRNFVLSFGVRDVNKMRVYILSIEISAEVLIL